MVEHVLRVLGVDDPRTVSKQDHIRPYFSRKGEVPLASRGGFGEGGRAGVPGRAAGGNFGVEYENIRRSLLHQPNRILGVEGIADREKIEVAGHSEHRKLMHVAKACGLERAAKIAVEPSNGREVMDPRDANPRKV